MKNLEKKPIEQLLSIIPNHPATRIMHISEGGKAFCDAIKKFVKVYDFEYLLNITDAQFYEEMHKTYDDEECCKVKKITLEQRRYVMMAKQYDFLFVTTTIPNELIDEFIKRVYGHIKSAGNIILFLPKNNLENNEKWRASLEEHFFVAINTIDLFEHYEIMIAKKMHGWGG